MGRNLSVDTVRVMSGLLGRQGGGGGDAEAEGTEGHWEEKSDSGHVDTETTEAIEKLINEMHNEY